MMPLQELWAALGAERLLLGPADSGAGAQPASNYMHISHSIC